MGSPPSRRCLGNGPAPKATACNGLSPSPTLPLSRGFVVFLCLAIMLIREEYVGGVGNVCAGLSDLSAVRMLVLIRDV